MRIGDTVTENGQRGIIVAFRPQDMVDVTFEGRDYPIRRPRSSLAVVRENPARTTPFVVALLTPEARKQVYRWWQRLPAAPAPLAIQKATYVTLKADVSYETLAQLPFGTPVELSVTGWAADKHAQIVFTTSAQNPDGFLLFAVAGPAYGAREGAALQAGKTKRAIQQVQGPTLTARLAWYDGKRFRTDPYQQGSGPQGGLAPNERAALDETAFARPGRRWPIHDRKHAQIALQYMTRGFGNATEYPAIVDAIRARFPEADPKNKQIWDFYAMHLKKNPAADDLYDPSKEQFRAVVQGVYESLVRKRVGVVYDNPFVAGTHRLDDTLDDTTRRQLLSQAYAIATRQGQKHGWLEPGTQTPTIKGVLAAQKRLQATDHAAENRQDYERTLARVRKSSHFRLVAEEHRDARGNAQIRYRVEPAPQGLVSIPAYRVRRDLAEQDLRAVEAAYARLQAAEKLRYNPRRNPAHWLVDYERDLRRLVDAFVALPDDEAAASAIASVDAMLLHMAVEDRSAPPRLAVNLLNTKLAERAALGKEVPFATAAEGIVQRHNKVHIPTPVVDRAALRRREEETVKKARDMEDLMPLLQAATSAWDQFRVAFETDLYRGANEGSKIGGLAGSQKNKQDSGPLRTAFDAALTALNRALHAHNLPALTEWYFLAKSPISAFSIPGDTNERKIAASDIPPEWHPQDGEVRKVAGPLTGITLSVVETPRTTPQQDARMLSLDRQQEERDISKARDAQSKGRILEPYWAVERTLLLYTIDYSGGTPRRRYYTYVLRPNETVQEAFRTAKFEPLADEDGTTEWPAARTRYVMYIPRIPIFQRTVATTGGVTALSEAALRGKAGRHHKPGSPIQYEAGGTRLYPSMRLTRFFRVDASGVGGMQREEDAEAEQNAAAQKKTLDTFLDGLGEPPAAVRNAMLRAIFAAAPKQTASSTKPTVLSPEDNWVKYTKASNLFRRLRQGQRDPVTREMSGGDRDAPLFDVFYTYSPELAYLTIMFFNTPSLMGTVQTHPEPVEKALVKVAGVSDLRQLNKPRVGDIDLALRPGYVGYHPTLTADFRKQIKKQTQTQLRPLKSAESFGRPLGISPEDWANDPLHMLLTEREFISLASSMRNEDLTSRQLTRDSKRQLPPPSFPPPTPVKAKPVAPTVATTAEADALLDALLAGVPTTPPKPSKGKKK